MLYIIIPLLIVVIFIFVSIRNTKNKNTYNFEIIHPASV